jgi:hypothetical protein
MREVTKKDVVYILSILPGTKKIWKAYTYIRWFRPTLRAIQREFGALFEIYRNNPKIKVQLIHDNGCSPPTFGNYLETLLLARYLSVYGLSVEYVLISTKILPIDWKIRGMSHNDKNEFIMEQLKLAKLILPKRVNFRTCHNYKLPNSKNVFILFKDKIRLKEINSISNISIYYLMIMHKFKYLKPFLLDYKKSTKNLNIFGGKSYICINFREGIWDLERNNNLDLFLSDITFLSLKYPKNDIVILSNPSSLIRLKNKLNLSKTYQTFEKKKRQILFQPEKGFTAAAKIVLGSEFYFQRNGGGMGMISIFSKIPYLIVMREVAYLENIRRGSRVVPWANENQKLLVTYDGVDKELKYLF